MKILVVDDNSDVREIIVFTLENAVNSTIIEAECGQDAIEMLQGDPEIDLVICDYNMPRGTGGDVYKYMLENDIDTPYVLCSSDLPEQHEEFKDDRFLFGKIIKPIIFEGIQEVLDRYSSLDKTDLVPVTDDYARASVNLISNSDRFPFEIFMHVGEKFIKVFNANQEITEEDLKKYTDKGVTHLYIEKDNAKAFTETLCDKIIKILTNESDSPEAKVTDAHSLLIQAVNDLGLKETVLRAVKASVDYTVDLLKRTNKDLLDGILNHRSNYLTEHSLAISVVSVAILKKTNWDSPENRSKLVMAGFIHDALIESFDFTESIFADRNDLETLINHSFSVIKLLESNEEFPEDVLKIVAEHHERPDGSGFPKKIDGNQFFSLSAVFVLAHDIVDAILKLKSEGKEVSKANVDVVLSKVNYNIGKFKKCMEAYQQAELFEGN